ncbi:MAG: DUF1553 domain-containing protein [Planctomycetaceae bacterium]|nr:DUF1553 domain-containing protein [Planctomycetaceae bacterium]
MLRSFLHISLSLMVSLLVNQPVQGESTPVDFTTQIRPILSNTCFHCHGPDEKERQGGLRLDTTAGVFGETDSGKPALVAGKPDESELLRRILSTDDSERMPPPESGMKVDEKSRELIRRWIQEGANYSGHWSYSRIVRPALPQVQHADWPRNPIDNFILSRLEKAGLAPQQEADRELLLRRVSLDLIGLPPTPEQVREFVTDDSPNAYEKVVDRLLASPHFGEHWARMWLDLARYADSAGYADDPPRTIWAFRDYVIKSLNENKPFDQFTIEQLAGDLLPDPTDQQLIATAFHRNTLTNNEGGTNDEEFRNAAVIDRVNTTFAVWMGTTMACAQCHTHKYDPISQQEYFEVFAILNNSEDADRRDESPLLEYFTDEQKQQRIDWEQEKTELAGILGTSTPELLAESTEWVRKYSQPLDASVLTPETIETESKSETAIGNDGMATVSSEADTELYRVQLSGPAESAGQKIYGIQLETYPGAGPAQNFVITDLSATIQKRTEQGLKARYVRFELAGKEKMVSLAEVEVFSGGKNIARSGKASQSTTDFGGNAELAIDGNPDGEYHKTKSTTHTAVSENPWWELDLLSVQSLDELVYWNRTDGNLQSRLDGVKISLLDEKRETVWSETIAKAPQKEQRIALSSSRSIPIQSAFADFEQSGFLASHVLDEKDPHKTGWAVGGQIDQPHTLRLISRKPFSIGPDETLLLTIAQKSQHAKHLLRQFRVAVLTDSRSPELARYPQPVQQALSTSESERTDAHNSSLTSYYIASVAPSLAKERKRLAEVEKSLAGLKPATTVPIMRELAQDKQRETHIQIRGNFMVTGDRVEPGLPEVFGVEHPDHPTRLDLAHWLISPENPLTPRVIANRYWEKLFGIGLVSSSEEFGSQGDLPTHPQLLDWLAAEILELKWNTKAMIKLLVMSAAYRQTSQVTPELLEQDPQNRLISRGPRFRLSAEMVRDQALFVSGLLSEKLYGAPVKPPQPNIGLSAAFGGGIDWQTSQGEDRYRRGLYTTWRRSNPYPSMAAFDAPNRETCTIRRDRTNTPLQAFVTLNDPVFIEAAQALGRRMADAPGTLEEKIALGIRTTVSRTPAPQEVERLVNLFETVQARYASSPEEARQLATDPLGPLPENADPATYAAWTLVGNVLLNLDEMLMKP